MVFFSEFFNTINQSLEAYLNATVSSVISEIAPVATPMAVLYFGWKGVMIINGMVQEPIMTFVKDALKISIILTLAFQTNYYHQFISDWLWQSPEALGRLMSSNATTGTDININFLDELLTKYYDNAISFFDLSLETGLSNLSVAILDLIVGLALLIFGCLMTAYTAYLLIFSKIGLAILLAIGPIFILLLIWDSTRKFFDAWIGQAINFVFLTMITTAIASLTMSILSSTMGNKPEAIISNAVPLIVLSIVSFLVMRQAPSIASALGGGWVISTVGTGWVGNKLGATGKAAGKASSAVAKYGYNSRVGTPLRKAVGYSSDKLDRLRGRYNSVSKKD